MGITRLVQMNSFVSLTKKGTKNTDVSDLSWKTDGIKRPTPLLYLFIEKKDGWLLPLKKEVQRGEGRQCCLIEQEVYLCHWVREGTCKPGESWLFLIWKDKKHNCTYYSFTWRSWHLAFISVKHATYWPTGNSCTVACTAAEYESSTAPGSANGWRCATRSPYTLTDASHRIL